MSTAESPNAGTAIARYTPLEAGIAEFLAKHENVVHDVATPKGLELAKKDRAECRSLRLRVEEARVAEKADALAYGRKVDSEAKRLTGIIAPQEESYDAQIKAEEQRREAERQAKIEAERQRVASIRNLIDAMKRSAAEAISMNAAQVEAVLRDLVAADPATVEATVYCEFKDEAIAAHAGALDFLRELHAKKVQQEEEAAQLARDRAELAEQQAAQAKREHEAKIEREVQERAEAEARAERERQEKIAKEAKERADREQREREDAARRQQLEIEAAELAEQRRQLEAQKNAQAEEEQRLAMERARQAQAKREEEAAAAAAKEAREASERAEQERKAAEEKRQAAAKAHAAQLAETLKKLRRKTPAEALALIGTIVDDGDYDDGPAREMIGRIVEANTPPAVAKAAEAEQTAVRA